jgi:tight adherence protein B
MASFVPCAVFLLLFAAIVLVLRSRSKGNEPHEELLRRMTPTLGDNDSDKLQIMRESKVKQSGNVLSALYRTNPGQWLEANIVQAGLYLSLSEALLIMTLLFLCGEAIGYLLFDGGFFSLGLAAGLAALPLAYIEVCKKRRVKMFGVQLPFALDLMKSSLEAGHTLGRGLQVVVQEFKEPLGPEFRTALEQSRVGVPLPRALEEMLKRVPDQDLSLLVVAVKVQTQVGSSLAVIIGRLGEIVRTRQRLRLQIRALTAQARMGGMLVGLLPLVVMLIFHVIRPSYVDLLFHDPSGQKILKTAFGLDLTALLVIRRLLRIDY